MLMKAGRLENRARPARGTPLICVKLPPTTTPPSMLTVMRFGGWSKFVSGLNSGSNDPSGWKRARRFRGIPLTFVKLPMKKKLPSDSASSCLVENHLLGRKDGCTKGDPELPLESNKAT